MRRPTLATAFPFHPIRARPVIVGIGRLGILRFRLQSLDDQWRRLVPGPGQPEHAAAVRAKHALAVVIARHAEYGATIRADESAPSPHRFLKVAHRDE